MATANSSARFTVPSLNNQNYQSWKFKVKMLLIREGTLEINGAEIYMVPGRPLKIDVPNCPEVIDSDTIEWEDEAFRLGKLKKDATYYNYCIERNMCTILPNGTLILQNPKESTPKYRVKVYDSAGFVKCSANLTVVVEETLQPPLLSYNCTGAGPSVLCSTSAKKAANLTLSWGTKSQITGEKIIARIIKEQNGDVHCKISNRAGKSEASVTTNCPVWDLYLIVSVAGGGAALLVFIALVVYSVKYKPWRRRSRSEEDVEINRPNTAQRQLPPPGGQTSSGAPSSSLQGDGTEHGLIQKPLAAHRPEEATPGGRKGKQTRSRRLPPPAPGQTTCETTPPDPQQSRPALPGNHPSEQAPRPQPRTKSKPPRQNRKSRH